MIALALIPTMAITGLALIDGNPGLAGAGIIRWLIDTALVVVLSALVFYWKYKRVHRLGF